MRIPLFAPLFAPLSRRPGRTSASSSSLERAYAWAFEKVLWPTWEEGVRGRRTLGLLEELRLSQWLPPEEIEALQLQRLRALLLHAGERIPYYRELFRREGFEPRELRDRRELAQLPKLTKEIVRERYEDLIDPAYRGRNLKKGTSGSTGQPFKFEYSPESEEMRLAMRLRGYEWGGYRVGGTSLHYWASVYGPPQGVRGAKLRLDRFLKRETFLDSMKQQESDRMQAVDAIRRLRPQVLVCYTQSAAELARFVLERGLRDWDDIPVLCGAEAVLPGDRRVLSQAFGPQIFETYGSREVMLMASECEAHDGLHLSEESLLVEVTRGGAPVGPGESGEVLVTDLFNMGMPFLRYANGDLATLADDRLCACGRGLRRLRAVDGRRADMLRDRDGRPIPGIVFHVLFSDSRVEVIQQFQVIQGPTGEVRLRVVRGSEFSEAAFALKVARFRDYLGELPFVVEFCESIPPQANGKHKTIFASPPASVPGPTPEGSTAEGRGPAPWLS